MFGISSLGWVHTIGSLPAIPAAIYMFARHGRIVPRSTAGAVYFSSMLFGSVTIFPIAHMPASYGIATMTIAFLLLGYGMSRRLSRTRAVIYTETISLTLTGFLLIVPTVSETLRRIPQGHPFAADLNSPLLHGAQATLLVMLVVGLAAQILYLRRRTVT